MSKYKDNMTFANLNMFSTNYKIKKNNTLKKLNIA